MSLIKKFLKDNFKYVIVFLLVIAIYEVFGFGINYGDPLSNYGFSYAIAKGQIPYLDFNTISTPLYAFYGAIGLLFWNNYLMFIIEHALLVTITFFFLYKLYGKKSYLVLACLIALSYYGILATYNFMLFSMMVIILYLEEKHSDKDYLIGFFIGLAILSKHTVGFLFIIPTFIKYFGNWKKILKRAIGCLIPCSIFIIYLILNGALFSFIDLCFLGLFDFSKSNGKPFSQVFYTSLLFLLLAIYLTYIKKSDIKNYYLLFTFFLLVPIFDYCHFPLFLASVLMMMIPYLRWNGLYDVLSFIIIVSFTLFSSFEFSLNYEPVFTSKFKHFEYTLNFKKAYENNIQVIDFINQYNNPIILSYFTMQYDIINDNKLDYYDIFMYGNFGFDGVNKMIASIKKMHDQTIIVSKNDYDKKDKYSQFAKKIADYVMENGNLIESKYGYEVYYME